MSERRRVLSPERLTAAEAVIGLGLVVAGLAMWWIPAALIVAGGALFTLAVWRR